MPRNQLVVAWASLLALAACGSSSGGTKDDAGQEDDAGIPDAGYPASPKSRIHFKGNRRIVKEFARILSIETSEVCTEFGLYSCTDLVHTVALGGTDPFGLGLHEPLPFTTITTPLAVDRVALFACRTRVDRDFENPDAALIFKGSLGDSTSQAVRDVVDTLYKKALLRPPRAEEADLLIKLHRDIAALGGSDVARDWSIATCFAITTGMEQLFY